MADRARDYVAAFNSAVTARDWTPLANRFAPDGRLEFTNVPVGPFAGRDAVLAAYRAEPPDDTIVIRAIGSTGGTDVVAFDWSRGGAGTLTLDWSADGFVRRAVVSFG